MLSIMSEHPIRKTLPHEIPPWVSNGSEYFITVCTKPRGVNQLCQPDVAEFLKNTLLFYQARNELWVHLFLLMPDHLHAILSFSPMIGMQKSMSKWKHYAAREKGINWQRDFFDHRLRKDESFVEKAHYIRMNPVRAGLVDSPESWPYVWTFCDE
jgi:putative transposase